MKKIKVALKEGALTAIGMLSILPQKAAAVTLPGRNVVEPFTYGSVTDFLTRIVNWILWLAAALALIYLIYGGVVYLTAGGNEDKAKAGKTTVLQAVIGIVIILFSLLIISWVRSILLHGTT